MQPHKWIRSIAGELLKLDGSADGEGHFLPGPTDIEWDLAGAIVEWNMDRQATQYLFEQFRKHGGKSSGPKLSRFVLAYSIFRMSYCRMALFSTQDDAEKSRLQRDSLFYESKVNTAVQHLTVNNREG